MIQCKNCGVELEQSMEYCPLCNLPVGENPENHDRSSMPNDSKNILKELNPFTEGMNKRLYWELVSLTLLSGVMVTLFIDLIFHKTLTWSLYSIIALCGTFVHFTLFLYTIKKPFLFLSGFLLNTIAMLLLFDLINLPISWSLNIGLPITISFVIVTGLIWLTAKSAKQKGFNVIAYILFGVSIYTLIIEVSIKLIINIKPIVSWSAVVITSIFPVCLFLMFLHYRLKKGTDLKKYFHL